jgi:alcohol dehydrogenase class IV
MNDPNLADTNTFFGEGALAKLSPLLTDRHSILLFSDKYSFGLCGAADYFEPLIKEFPITPIPYWGKALPIDDVQGIYQKAAHIENVDLIIGIGGGTIIDLAKIFSLAYSNRSTRLEELLENQNLENKIDLIFVPTTAGTGSEATSFAVMYKDRVKFSIDAKTLLPRYSILDPTLLRSLPEGVLNATVLDALGQAIESLWAIGATQESREYASKAISLILEGMEKKQPLEKLGDLQLGAHLSGKAINISKTTISHSISYPLTAYFDIPHGIAVFLTLPRIAVLNYNTTFNNIQEGTNIERIQKDFSIIFSLFKVRKVEDFADRLNEIMARLKVNTHLQSYSLRKQDLKMIASKALTKGRSDNNPRKVDKTTIYKILEGIY